MKKDHFLDKFHFFIEGQFHRPEDTGDHLGTDEIMSVECPAGFLVIPLGDRFGNIMQHGRPSQPEIIGYAGHIIHNLQGVVKIIFVPLPVLFMYSFQFMEFRENEG